MPKSTRIRESNSRETPPASSASGAFKEAARRLNEEFGAPVGLFDSHKAEWTCLLGAPPELFLAPAPEAAREVLKQNRPVVRASATPEQATWLYLPVPGVAGGDSLVAAVGFSGRNAGDATGNWGPPCPERALLAWGQAAAQALAASPVQAMTGPAASDRGERLITARLIRRLRISDPPERFQQLATNAVRTAMNVQSLAWIPYPQTEPVVVSGETGQLQPEAYRRLLPSPQSKEVVWVENQSRSAVSPEILRIAAASADSHNSVGWLIALNPLDGRAFGASDLEILQPVASLISTQQSNACVYADLKDLLFGVIRALTSAIDAKDPYTLGHSERVARIAVRLAEELGMPANQRGDLYLTGLLHDVGKIGVDDNVLKKPGPLTPDEYKQIQAHVEIGVHILADLKKLRHLLPGVRHHHESLDGSGYPCGLAGEAIPWEARILAVADSFDAMSSTRPYRRKLTPSQIDDILRKGSGSQWDPKVIDALFACRMDIEMIRQKGIGESLHHAVGEMLGRN